MPQDLRLPIKVVIPKPADSSKREPGGSERKLFGEVDAGRRDDLVRQVEAVSATFLDSFREHPHLRAVACVILKPAAIAKTHRPFHLLREATCPIIGAQYFGQLLISVDRTNLEILAETIATFDTPDGIADISSVESIQPYRTACSPEAVAAMEASLSDGDASLRVLLFSHHDPRIDRELEDALNETLKTFEAEGSLARATALNYAPRMRVYSITGLRPAAVQTVLNFIGTRSLSRFPTYRVVRSAATAIRALVPHDFPAPEAGRAYPVVGVVDTGTNPDDPYLAPWVVERDTTQVPAGRATSGHGSFVAGLIVNARGLNKNDDRFPESRAQIVDVVGIPDEGITEPELLTIMENVLPKYQKVRVWNMSLASDEPCANAVFSPIAIAMDRLADEHDKIFVFPAGNFTEPPLPGWPREILHEDDRLAPPGDAVRGVTVAGIAHTMRANSRVKEGDPAPFGRRGPGPSYLPKPDVSHWAGNCDARGDYAQTGILSLDGRGQLTEDIGTSYPTPIVSAILANIDHGLLRRGSRHLIKALLIQSAILGAYRPRTAHEMHYRGFGIPGDAVAALTCRPWSATLIFELDVVSGIKFTKSPFPIPPCMRRGDRVSGRIAMTLAYDPILNPEDGSEYCRVNVEASLGSFDVGKDGKREHRRKIPPEPQNIREMYERFIIENGFKWSPVKIYRRDLRNVKGEQWRLKVEGFHRVPGVQVIQPIALVVTLEDPTQKAPVYDQVVELMAGLQWETVDLEIQERIRERS